MKMKVIDATGLVLGRLASVVAKSLLKGEKIVIVNAEKCIISGDRYYLINKYLERVWRGSKTKGPYYPKRPDGILRRAIRGMLPYKKERGRKAFKNLEVYIGVPDEYANIEKIQIEEAKPKNLRKYMVLEELCRYIGWNG